MAKSAALVPLATMLVTVICTSLLLVMVNECPLLVLPTGWLPKSVVPAAWMLKLAAVPVPETGTLVGLTGALLLMSSDAERLPAAPGVNVTLMMQLLFGVIAPVLQLSVS